MTITYKNGNVVDALINGEIDALLHVCNNKGVMGSGIALQIKNRVPDAWHNYDLLPKFLGGWTCGKVRHTDNTVYNLVAQDGYGRGIRHLNYGALSSCLHDMAELFNETTPSFTIGLPYKMGADRAGGDWEIVLELIEYFLKDFNVVIYKLEG